MDTNTADAFPTPWTFDNLPHPIPTFSSATIFDAKSTRICQTKGEHAETLAKIIVHAVNEKNRKEPIELSQGAKELLQALQTHPLDGNITFPADESSDLKSMAIELVNASLADTREIPGETPRTIFSLKDH